MTAEEITKRIREQRPSDSNPIRDRMVVTAYRDDDSRGVFLRAYKTGLTTTEAQWTIPDILSLYKTWSTIHKYADVGLTAAADKLKEIVKDGIGGLTLTPVGPLGKLVAVSAERALEAGIDKAKTLLVE